MVLLSSNYFPLQLDITRTPKLRHSARFPPLLPQPLLFLLRHDFQIVSLKAALSAVFQSHTYFLLEPGLVLLPFFGASFLFAASAGSGGRAFGGCGASGLGLEKEAGDSHSLLFWSSDFIVLSAALPIFSLSANDGRGGGECKST